jgi:nitronate monooxygenase
MHFNPRQYLDADLPPLKRPRFLSIISSNTLAITMLKKANGRVDGFVVETPVAGGHNAPPRGAMQLSPSGEPIYGERDVVDLPRLRELNVPFWLAGGYGTPDMIRHALEQGAAGVQVGTAFAFSLESGLDPDIRRRLLASAVDGSARVFTDPLASPTGYPFKVALLENSASEASVFAARPRICDLGYLREPYRTPEGEVGYRCASEPVTIYESKGGALPETVGRKCVCNALLANIGMPQTRKGNRTEAALVTTGDDLVSIPQFLPPGQLEYTVSDVLKVLLPPGIEALRQPTVAFSV